ncbi:hypothetical protein ROJ8625_00212 [Roseivivax jejudonensis]|uniref:Uncharacterized protein n=1 Tax=Roseivivax jejudonensis TaxID=1529041 RepID=A0A1X6Y5C7_9RHOB|nr:hypothetical protein [Roseivivax jejudonensis]SLN10402.1 hypothetical protein ROJ8625_00212 [Roseivivax jejudonensis]
MTNIAKILSACGLAIVMATPVAAQMDVSSITCAEFQDMDQAGQLEAATALVERLGSRQNPDSARVRLNNICGSNEAATTILTAATAGMTMDD